MKLEESQFQKICRLRDVFIKQVDDRDLFDYQKRFSDRILRVVFENLGETVVGEWTRQSGKTTVSTDTVAFLLNFYFIICNQLFIKTTRQFNVGFFAPQLQQSQSSFFMLKNILRKAKERGFDLDFDTFNGNTINVRSSKYPIRTVYCMTASPTSKQESKTLNLIMFDESQDLIDKVIDKAIAPMGASTNANEVWIGVAGYKKCRFLENIERSNEVNRVIIPYNMVLDEHKELFNITGNDIYLNYHKHIEKRKREIGEDSDEFKTQYKLQWVLERGQFITFEQLMELESDYIIKEEYSKNETLYGGIDWGKAYDSTSFTVVDENCKLIEWYEWQGDDYASQIEEIEFLIKNKYHGMKLLHCDSTGNQDMAVDMLKRKLNDKCEVIGVPFTAPSKDEMFKNLSRLMSKKIIGGHVVQEAVFKFPLNKDTIHKEKFIRQMCDLQKEVKGELWRCQAPAGPGYHDDYCCSVALACLAFLPRKENSMKTYRPMIG